MCGIVGFIDGTSPNKNILQEMMHQIIHRGPDDSGSYLDERIALGHRRLSIIDLAGGTQPMKNEDGRLICIFNGEIYNYQKLKKELQANGHTFATESDTEVLVHGYEQWGKELPGRLRGMFAFAIWDREKRELFCARDYFGIKPFYYYHKNDVFLFGSEIKSFLPHPRFEKVLNRNQLDLYLSYQYSPGETTFFENVYKLLPAHFMIWKDGKIEITCYYQPEFAPEYSRTKTEWEMEIDAAMRESVSAHKISDVEVGSFLSSGVDSSYVTALAGVDKTFTVGYAEDRTKVNEKSEIIKSYLNEKSERKISHLNEKVWEKYDESNYAGQFCMEKEIQNFTYRITSEEFWEKLPDIQYYMDEPLADAASAALYFLNREASRHVKVCLSGEGADELFGGYRIYKEPFMCKPYDWVPLFIRRVIGVVAELLPPMPGVNFLVRHSRPLSQRYIGNTSIFTQKQKRKILKTAENDLHKSLGRKTPTDISKPYFLYLGNADNVTRMQFTDIHLWLVGDILLKADKMSMANSLELRVPFLDKKVFEVARQIPTAYRVNAQETKIALRGASKYLLGEENANREKLGFPVPVREWLREEPYVSMVRKCFESPVAKEFFRIKKLYRLLDEHVKGKRDNWRQIWCVYMFLVWYEEYFVKR